MKNKKLIVAITAITAIIYNKIFHYNQRMKKMKQIIENYKKFCIELKKFLMK